MNTSAVVPRLDLVGGRPVTTSLNVAEVFGKHHHNVLRAIKSLDVPADFNALNFELVTYVDDKGESRPMYQITRDGFTLLAMGFTGKAAMQFKLAYIEAFNRMEQELLAGGQSKRADIFHHRGPVSGSGLDIRYTLDLTKILARPTKTSLTLLQRLTGVEVVDLAESLADVLPGGGLVEAVRAWADGCTVFASGSDLLLADCLSHYNRWRVDQSLPASLTATGRSLAAAVRSLGLPTVRRGGHIYTADVAMTSEVSS